MKKPKKIIVVIALVVCIIAQNYSLLFAAMMDETNVPTQSEETSNETSTDTSTNVEEETDEEGITDVTDDTISCESITDDTNENVDMFDNSVDVVEENVETNDELDEAENKVEEIATSKSGRLYVNIDLRLPQAETDLSVSLEQNGKKLDLAPEFSKGEGNDTKLYYTFDKLDPGTYTIRFTGTGYVQYAHDVEIKENTTSEVSYTNGNDMLNLGDSNVNSKFGIVQLGDIDGNKSITNADILEVISKIESPTEDKGYKYDLNGDGEVNIVDLSYVAINNNPKLTTAIPSFIANINTEDTEIAVDETTILEGEASVEDILKNNDAYVSLKPAGGEDISVEHPVEISLDMSTQEVPTEYITIAPSINPENNIESGTVEVEGEVDGVPTTVTCEIVRNEEIRINNVVAALGATTIASQSEGRVEVNADGTIVVDLGGKVAVKKVKIKVTGTKSNKLADIAKVEFLNGMSDKIPEPKLDIPDGVKADVTEETITVSWNYVPNVTGYEVLVTSEGESETHLVDGHMITLEFFNGTAIKDLLKTPSGEQRKYEISVRSVNGEWFSGYSDPVIAEPKATSAPNAPTGVKVTGAYKEINVSWDLDNRADTYEVWYREMEQGEFKLAGDNIKGNSLRISELKEKTKYQAYVIAVNTYGKSKQSITGTAETTAVQPVKMPKRKLINKSKGEGALTEHIENVVLNKDGNKRFMVDSKLDDENSAKGIVDDSYFSFFQVNDWDLGGWYTGEKAPTVEFDAEYTLDFITVAQAEWTGSLNYANVIYYDANGVKNSSRASQVYTKQDEDGRFYTVIKLPEPITAKRISVNVGRGNSGNGKITIAEMNFYHYDDLEDRINALYEDQMHVKLKENVLLKDIEALEEEVNRIDEETQEYHPEREKLLVEINEAKELYINGSKVVNTVKIDDNVTSFYDSHIEFRNSGMNAWQPLGVVAHSGDQVTIYVGNEYKNVGDSTELELIVTQYHGYASNWSKVLVQNLKVGKNVVEIPKMLDMDVEKGGSLYINYKGMKDDHPFKSFEKYYGVRVEGAEEIPVLDITKVEDTKEAKMEAITNYVTELTSLMDTIDERHNDVCVKAGEDYGEKEYGTVTEGAQANNEVNCILGATEIVMDHMMYSVSAKQILEGLEGDTIEKKAESLYDSIETMDDMIDLFYANKGLSELKEAGAKNQYPRSRLNIRYMRMTGKAFMYAGGSHIGIEWPEVKILSQGHQIVTDEYGKYISGNNFGWGIAHEIGHAINQQAYVHGEVTNNYFSVLSQAEDTNESVRFEYPEVYKKVTSGKTGKSQNVFTQLGLYWQLHLAYDKNGYNFKTYDTYDQVKNSYVFARIDSYARDVNSAPKGKDNIKLELTDDKDNNLMRLACAATEKNVLDFFIKWGMVPNEETINYANQWDKETRAIWYVNDDARAYELSGGARMLEDTTVVSTIKNDANSNKVVISLSNNHEEENKDAILGYEIVRSYMSNDEEIEQTVAFVTGDVKEYTDTIDTLNNRAFTYKVKAYDKYLTSTEQLVLPAIKVSHDGTLGAKDDWEIDTDLVSELDKEVEIEDKYKADEITETQKGVLALIDGDYNTDYTANIAEDKESGEIVVTLNGVKRLVGFKYTSNAKKELKNYEVQVSTDGVNYEKVKEGDNVSFDENNTKVVYFNKTGDDKLYMYDTVYVKFVIKDSNISISELDLIGQTGDNVELLPEGIGILSEKVSLGNNDETGLEEFIPEGSIVFTGTYKGNPAYNVVKLWDENNNIVEGTQVFFADDVEEGGELGEVSDGIWIYWIEQKITDESGAYIDNPVYNEFLNQSGKTVRAELYRVDNATTLENERLTSDTLRISVPEELKNLQIQTKVEK